MRKLIALILVIIICSLSLVSCQINFFSIIHQLRDETPGYFTYTDFTSQEKELFNTYIGEIIPFIPNDKYFVTSFYGDGNFEEGIRFYTYYNTAEEFSAYLGRFTDYTLERETTDEYGITWRHFVKGNIVVAAAYYQSLGIDLVDIYVFLDEEAGEVVRDSITNDGAGLPDGKNGVFGVDFTSAEHVKNVRDMALYENGCPTTGSPAMLVIPVQFSDSSALAKGYTIEAIKKAFNGKTGSTDYYSIDEYYKLSSYGALDLDITVLDSWFTPKHRISYYKSQTMEYNGTEQPIGDQMILNEALDYLEEKMDLSKFDTDGNGYIDSVVMINTLSVDNSSTFSWAFRFWNIYSDEEGSLYSYDGVTANDYAWMSYSFMHESKDRWGMTNYNNKNGINTKTYIHEIAHILGAEDYYDTSYEDPEGPLHGNDIMDSSLGDHNPYTKISLGWITSSRLVTTDSTVTLTLEDFSKNGDTIIIGNNFDPTLGAFQEYFILTYYKGTGLNNSTSKCFDRDGVVIYHVNASLYYEMRGEDIWYALDNDNDSGGSHKNFLLELVGINLGIVEINRFVFTEGSVLATITDDSGSLLPYIITIDSISEEKATITFKKY